MQLPQCISQGVSGRPKAPPTCPWLRALPCQAACSTALARAMAAASSLHGWLDSRPVAKPCHALATAPRTPRAPRLSMCITGPALHRELSRNGSSRGCWRLIPRRIYHQVLQGADSPRASAKLQQFAAGLQAPARARLGIRAAAITVQQLPS